MKKWGLYLLLFGILSFILPIFGFQFQIFNIFGEGQAAIALLLIGIGIVLFFIGKFKERGVTKEKEVSLPPQQPVEVQGLSCPVCGEEITTEDQFCGSCGGKIELVEPVKETLLATCPSCSTPLSRGEQFCGECGHKVTFAEPIKEAPPITPPATKQRKRRTRPIAIFAVILLLIGGIFTVLYYSQREDIKRQAIVSSLHFGTDEKQPKAPSPPAVDEKMKAESPSRPSVPAKKHAKVLTRPPDEGPLPVRRGWIGVSIGEVNKDLADAFGLTTTRGVFIVDVDKGGPAERSGIMGGDIILRFDGKDVFDPPNLASMVAKTPIGKNVAIAVWRDRKRTDLRVTIGEKTASLSSEPSAMDEDDPFREFYERFFKE